MLKRLSFKTTVEVDNLMLYFNTVTIYFSRTYTYVTDFGNKQDGPDHT